MVNKEQKKELRKLIAELENPFPKDDCIITYANFLKHRELLPYYRYNPAVMLRLVTLATTIWETNSRINRLSLIKAIGDYGDLAKTKDNKSYYDKKQAQNEKPFTYPIAVALFELFRNLFEKPQFISPKQLEAAWWISNRLLRNVSLHDKEEQWLCDHALSSEIILNRVLRYPVKSAIISNWARTHFLQDSLRSRRAELTSWLIDEDPAFELGHQTLIDDFEYLNKCDRRAIKDYHEEKKAMEAMKRELGDFLPKKNETTDLFTDSFGMDNSFDLQQPELKLAKRFYPVPVDYSKNDYPVSIPDFTELRKDFLSNIGYTQKSSMIWSIAYSRHTARVKSDLLRKYCTGETIHTIMKICRKFKILPLLKWLQKK